MPPKLDERMASTAYELWQDGECVVMVSAPTAQQAWDEIWHYAMVYAQDGKVSIKAVEETDGNG